MAKEITSSIVREAQQRLAAHPIYAAVATIDDLRCFMQHHVYSVWDFMSLIKHLQGMVAPASCPWNAAGDASVRRFVNELVLEEESDEHPVNGGYTSHFDLYLSAMEEVGADTVPVRAFVDRVRRDGIDAALQQSAIPEPSRRFTRTTFDLISAQRPHLAAAALAIGREHIVPCMFRAILQRIGVNDERAPMFHAYLNRHVHLDEDFHAPLSLRLLNSLCAGDPVKIGQAVDASQRAIAARMTLWDGVLSSIKARKAA